MTDNPNHTNNCEAARELLPAYSIGMTDPDETAFVEMMMASCPELSAELATFRQLEVALLHSAPPQEPSPNVLNGLMAAATPEAHNSDPSTTRLPDNITHLPPIAQTTTAIPSTRQLRWTLMGLVAVAAFLFALNVAVLTQNVQLGEQLNDAVAMLSIFGNNEAVTFTLNDMRDPAGNATATVICHPDETYAILNVENVPQLANGALYDIWLWRDGERTLGGQLVVDAGGSAQIVFRAPQPMGHYEYASIVPVDGSDPGFSGPILRGALYPLDEDQSA